MTGWSFTRAPFLIAGPCVVESSDVMAQVADALARLAERHAIPVCFKASFDKANRARLSGTRGPGLENGLRALEQVRDSSGLPVLTDVHAPEQAAAAGAVVDALQVPAFLCRQTDLLVAAGGTKLPVNVKKGQWVSADTMAGAVEKIRHGGSADVAVTERGSFFGYGDLVVDFRNLERLRDTSGAAVVFDATHSVQRPGGGMGGASGGDRRHVPALLAAAAVAGADGFFVETHPDPDEAASDRATQWPLARLDALMGRTLDLWRRARELPHA